MREVGLIDTDYLRGASLADRKNTLVRRARGGQRAIRELDNLINLRWYTGQPWYRRIPDTTRVVGLPPDGRQRYVHINKSFEICRTLKGVMWYEPEIEASPRTPDTEDAARAEMAEMVGRHIIRNGELGRAYARVLDLCNINGGGWIKVLHDPTAGSRRPTYGNLPCPRCQGEGVLQGAVGPMACPVCATQGLVLRNGLLAGQGQVTQYLRTESEGEIVFMPVHPDDMFVDPEAPTMDDADKLVHRTRMPKSKAWRMYGRGVGMSERDFESGGGAEDNVYSLAAVGPHFQRPADEDYVYVYEYMEKPSEQYPDGVYGVCIGSKTVLAGRLPPGSDDHPFPFFFFPMYEVEGMQYPMSTMDLVLPLIIALNDHTSILHQRARLSAKLRWKMPRESRAEIDERTGHVEYNARPGWPSPEPVGLAPYPQDAANILDVLSTAIESISGASEVVKGQFGSQDTSARAMAFLEERAIGPLKPIIANHTRKLEAAVQFGIELAGIHFEDGRLLRIPGETGSVELQEFRVANLGEGTDVRLNVVRHPGRSRATTMAEINEAAANSMIDAQTYMELAEFGEMGALYKEVRVHRNHALMENRMLIQQGQMPAPGLYEEHRIHLKEHRKKLASLRMNDPFSPLIPILQQHIQETEMLAAHEAVQVQLQQQAAAAGYGMANAADPSAQPQQAVDAAQAAGAPQAAEPYQNQPPGAPGTQPSIDMADAAAMAAEET